MYFSKNQFCLISEFLVSKNCDSKAVYQVKFCSKFMYFHTAQIRKNCLRLKACHRSALPSINQLCVFSLKYFQPAFNAFFFCFFFLSNVNFFTLKLINTVLSQCNKCGHGLRVIFGTSKSVRRKRLEGTRSSKADLC